MRKQIEADLRAQLAHSDEQVASNDASEFEKKLAAAQQEMAQASRQDDAQADRMAKEPHFVNLNEDPTLAGRFFRAFGRCAGAGRHLGRVCADADSVHCIPRRCQAV